MPRFLRLRTPLPLTTDRKNAVKNIWLYHINPKSPERYSYGWDIHEPKTMLKTKDREWPASQMRYQVAIGDMLCVYLKKMKGKPDGVYIAGTIVNVYTEEGTFIWQPNSRWSSRLLVKPVLKETLRSFFGRGYGGMQRLPHAKKRKWQHLLMASEVFEGVPVIIADKSGGADRATSTKTFAGKENGVLGEKFILKLLKQRYSKVDGYEVVHVAASEPSSDHDISVHQGGKLVRIVEVKTRVGLPDDRVLISEHELRCRKLYKGKHSIFIVYLGSRKDVMSVIEVQTADAYTLSPRQYWLRPSIP